MELRAVFLDREGVLTRKLEKGAYLLRTQDAVLEAGVIEALRPLVDRRIPLFIVTNQSCVSRGMITPQECGEIHQRLVWLLANGKVPIAASKICPHTDEDACDCRKPKPGMILELCREFGINPSQTAMIGDSTTDVEAGRAAGCAINILLRPNAVDPTNFVVATLQEAVELLNEH